MRQLKAGIFLLLRHTSNSNCHVCSAQVQGRFLCCVKDTHSVGPGENGKIMLVLAARSFPVARHVFTQRKSKNTKNSH